MAELGCLCCCIYHEDCEEQGILYVEHWQSMAEFEHHIKENNYSKILEAMELSSRRPEVSFYVTNKTWGLELVERLRAVNWN